MAARVTANEVRGIIDSNVSLSLTPFIDAANGLTTWVDGEDTDGDLSDADLKNIEKWLAAHFYAIRDQLLHSEKNLQRTGRFQGKTEMYLDSTLYGQQAMVIDHTGALARRNDEMKKGGKKKATLTWLGRKPKNQEFDLVDND